MKRRLGLKNRNFGRTFRGFLQNFDWVRITVFRNCPHFRYSWFLWAWRNPFRTGKAGDWTITQDLGATEVEFSGIRGWFVRSAPNSPCIILMHGVRADRRSMVERARFLRKQGYSSLLFDFQAHGESPGTCITFGYLESQNARNAVEFLRSKFHCIKIAMVGQSLGGAAALLGESPLKVNALILESVYPTIEDAVSNRLQIHLGSLGSYLVPLLTFQFYLRLGINGADLRPLSKIQSLRLPVFIIAGTADRHTRIEESKRLFEAASPPKQFWAVPGAAHVDLYRYARKEYEARVIQFLDRYL